ncbi:epsin-3-like [Magnolia sinica]|uniref:epsin-3-like n=1 Tax=Magnolia sinica TaxID=86752 RepID=UPI0026593C2D|nr:epsin-3-like [Magnolia sinica]
MSSIVGSNNMGTPFFHELKKQASFFLREKIKTARLALTDVTPAELLTEEATNGNPWAPDTRTMGLISRAAFEIDDYWRIVEILHKRLARYDIKHWRESYQALVLLEHLITHGPESVAAEFRSDQDVIRELESFQYIDERGFNWGLTVRKKSERILQLLEKGPLLKEERDRARKLTRGIEGFGSFCQRSSSSADKEQSFNTYGRCNSHYSGYSREEDLLSSLKEGGSIKQDKSNEQNKEIFSSFDQDKEMENSNPSGSFNRLQIFKNEEFLRQPLKENKAHRSLQNSRKVSTTPMKKHLPEEFNKQNQGQAPNPLLDLKKNNPKIESSVEEDHPFSTYENQTTASLLSLS